RYMLPVLRDTNLYAFYLLDHPLPGDQLAALRHRHARLDRVQFDEARVEVTARNDTAQMEPVAVGANDIGPALEGLVGQDRHTSVHRTDGANGCAQRAPHFVRVGGAELLAEGARQLAFVNRVIATDDGEHR